MALTYLSMQDTVLHQMGDFSGATRTKVKQWINTAYNLIWDQVGGLHKEATDYVTTPDNYKPDSDDYTVLATNASTTLTSDGSSNTVFTSAMAGRYIQVNSTDPWYRIASVTSALEIELEDAYIGSTNAESGFEVHTYRVSMPSNMHRLIQVVAENEEREYALRIKDRVDVAFRLPVPLRWSRMTPSICWLEEQDTSGYHYLGYYPVPDDPIMLKIRYQKNITELSGDGDVSAIPGADAAITNYALFTAMQFKGGKRANQAQIWMMRYETELQRLMVSVSRSKTKVVRRIDTTGSSKSRDVRDVNLGAWY